ncbi:MAG: glycosyltransferase, partial [Planctomycetes bacterium]|nr:glycosyltransferase [Planctomycetota bacterium]
LVPSRWLQESLTRQVELPLQSLHVLSHGLCEELSTRGLELPLTEELSTARALANSSAPEREGPLTVLHFGNRARIKGALDLVRAAAKLPKGSVRLILLGEELEKGLDDELVRAADGQELRIHGRYTPEELSRFAREADLAAFPSRASESYGLVVDEALALGLPTLVSDAGALPERLASAGHGGRYPGRVLPQGDLDAWAECLRSLVTERGLLQDARAVLPDWLPTAAHTARELERRYTAIAAVDERRAS